jgi:hypothetical protein
MGDIQMQNADCGLASQVLLNELFFEGGELGERK